MLFDITERVRAQQTKPPIFSKTLQIKPGPRLWIILFRSVLEVFTEVISKEMIAEQVRQSCRASAGQEVGAKLEVPLF